MANRKSINNSSHICSEYEEQKTLVEYLILNKIKHTAIPNSTYTTSWKQKMKNKMMGLCAGFPDMAVIIGDTLLLLEMKKKKGGQVSPSQKEWIEQLKGCKRVVCDIAYGFDEAKEIIDKLKQ